MHYVTVYNPPYIHCFLLPSILAFILAFRHLFKRTNERFLLTIIQHSKRDSIK